MCLGLFPEVLREAGLCVCSLRSQAAGHCLLGCASPNLRCFGHVRQWGSSSCSWVYPFLCLLQPREMCWVGCRAWSALVTVWDQGMGEEVVINIAAATFSRILFLVPQGTPWVGGFPGQLLGSSQLLLATRNLAGELCSAYPTWSGTRKPKLNAHKAITRCAPAGCWGCVCCSGWKYWVLLKIPT